MKYRSNINTICDNLRMGFRKPREHWEKSKIIRKGKTLENGDILWMEDGRLYIEKKGN